MKLFVLTITLLATSICLANESLPTFQLETSGDDHNAVYISYDRIDSYGSYKESRIVLRSSKIDQSRYTEYHFEPTPGRPGFVTVTDIVDGVGGSPGQKSTAIGWNKEQGSYRGNWVYGVTYGVNLVHIDTPEIKDTYGEWGMGVHLGRVLAKGEKYQVELGVGCEYYEPVFGGSAASDEYRLDRSQCSLRLKSLNK